jgi:hypothetical protein
VESSDASLYTAPYFLASILPAKHFPAPPVAIMKFVVLTALAMAASVFSAAVPQPVGEVVVEKRQLEPQLSVLDTLYAAVVEQTAQISTLLPTYPIICNDPY